MCMLMFIHITSQCTIVLHYAQQFQEKPLNGRVLCLAIRNPQTLHNNYVMCFYICWCSLYIEWRCSLSKEKHQAGQKTRMETSTWRADKVQFQRCVQSKPWTSRVRNSLSKSPWIYIAVTFKLLGIGNNIMLKSKLVMAMVETPRTGFKKITFKGNSNVIIGLLNNKVHRPSGEITSKED